MAFDQQEIEKGYFKKLLYSIWISTGLLCLAVFCLYTLVQQWRQRDLMDLKDYIDLHSCGCQNNRAHQNNDQKVVIERSWTNEDSIRELAFKMYSEKEKLKNDAARNSGSN